IQDTYALFAAPLRALSVFAGEEKHDIGLAEDVIFDPSNPEHVEYLKADVRILYQAYRAYHRVLHQTFGINPRLTAGGCAIAAMSRCLPCPIYRQREPGQEFVRRAYFGGLTLLRSRVSHREAAQWDARGMYAWAMKQPLPIGRAFYTREEHPDLLGIYKVGVRAPEDIPFTFVPYRLREGGVAWPTGQCVTYLPSVTTSYAGTLGYEIDVLEGYVFPGYDYPLRTFIERCEELELENKGNALGAAIKILRNSGYGKFAQKKQHNKLIFNPAPPDGAMPIFDLQTGLNIASAYVITEAKELEFGFIEGAAFIAAYARFNLARAVYQAGPENVVLGDTDSLVTIRQRRPEPYI